MIQSQSFHLLEDLNLSDPSLLCGLESSEGIDSLSAVEGSFSVIDPCTGKEGAIIIPSSPAQIDHAIRAASATFPSFSSLPSKVRAQKIAAFDALLRSNLEDIAKIIAWETGKPMSEARGEVEYAASFSWWSVGEAERVHGQTIRGTANPNLRFITIKQPIGPVALLTPWNFPVALFVRKAATALAAGCTVVAKPSPETPLSTLAVSLLFSRAGFPDGTVNIVFASNETTPSVGQRICSDPRIKKVSFTGSTRIGRVLMSQCSESLKKLTLELGGLGAFLVFEKADLKKAAEGLISNKFRHAGQTCIAAQRVFVHSSVLPNFLSHLEPLVAKIRMGLPHDPETNLGPLTTSRSVLKAQSHVSDAIEKGAKLHFQGSIPSHLQVWKQEGGKGGYWFPPTILIGCQEGMLVFQEESFAPILCISTFETEEEALDRANSTSMGLTNYVFSQDVDQVWRAYEKLRSGNVGINTGITTSAEAPFGGIDQSGFGKEAGIGAGISEYLFEKTATMTVSPLASA
ncbi:aldehyde dehydrogenase [Violaceomyces palustris]|uniref:Aldehyde dehydrogenase n=1 Tax=Violaceomyces palustris TaxID=1673888 RepID=A0ACD0NRY3_9BASI|nr:aldehyde dehydrogenase [Violaceomyces palustris]